MDEREAEADRDGGEPGRRALVGGTEDDQEKEEGQDDLGDEAGEQ